MIIIKNMSLNLFGAAGKVEVLKHINLNIETGEVVSIIGPSGSGKSSLISIIAGLEKPTYGDVIISNQNISNLNETDLAIFRGKNIGIVFQSFHLINTMTALENVAIPLELAGKKNSIKFAEKMLEQVGLMLRKDHYPTELSGGEQQRIAIARAFISNPPLILADEPTGNLDSENSNNIVNLLLEMRKNYNTTLVFVTHDSSIASKCDRVIKISDGQFSN